MTISPPASPTGASPRPMSGMIRPPRSNSRMSTGSRQDKGSRASDEDSKTAVKVGMSCASSAARPQPMAARVTPIQKAESKRLTCNHSCPSATALETHRSWLRVDPPAVSTLDGSCHLANQPGSGCSAGPQGLRLRQSLSGNDGPRGHMGVSERQRELVSAGLQCLHPRLRSIRSGQILYHGNLRSS